MINVPAIYKINRRYGWAEWVVLKCPFCGKKHTHNAGKYPDKGKLLGARYSHCNGDRYSYNLVSNIPNGNRITTEKLAEIIGAPHELVFSVAWDHRDAVGMTFENNWHYDTIHYDSRSNAQNVKYKDQLELREYYAYYCVAQRWPDRVRAVAEYFQGVELMCEMFYAVYSKAAKNESSLKNRLDQIVEGLLDAAAELRAANANAKPVADSNDDDFSDLL